MYSLYDMTKLELLIKDKPEEEIYKAICNRLKVSENQRLLIKTKYKNGDVIVCAIRNQEDFINHLKDYEYMKIITCVQNINVSQCDVSSPKDYNKVCGDSSPIHKSEEMRQKNLNQSSSEDQPSSGVIALLFIALAIPAFLIAIRLSH